MSYKSNINPMFRSKFSEDIFNQKYRHEGAETWEELATTLVRDVNGTLSYYKYDNNSYSSSGPHGELTKSEEDQLIQYIKELKFIPGGRYLYYAGRKKKFFNNCFLLKAEKDTREDWSELARKVESCLMTGGGIGVDYSVYRGAGIKLSQTGGLSSGPLPAMYITNEQGRNVMQGGSRRSAIYASLNWRHADVDRFLIAKDWKNMPVGDTGKSIWDIKQTDFNFPAPLDMTNISVNYDTNWLLNYWETGDVGEVFRKNVKQALSTSEPGFSFNFFDKENETLRNACTEVTSEDDSDVCNLGSINLGRIDSITEFIDVITLATKFLLLGTLRADLPYDKVYQVRDKNRRLGLGLMGIHEWLLKRGYKYEVTPELHKWLKVYETQSDRISRDFADRLSISRPVANRAIAPTGSIGILAGTSTGIEPIFAVAYKRRYLTDGTKWKYQYVVDSTAQELIEQYDANPDEIESALDLAANYERRIKFQADIQDYVDMSISSTINLPPWGTLLNNEDKVDKFAKTLADYAPRLRGFTAYADGSRGGQPLTSVPYSEAKDKLGEVFEESVSTHDICVIGKGGESGCN
jgi:ribonucleoside-diphosphate reductase alpha chain